MLHTHARQIASECLLPWVAGLIASRDRTPRHQAINLAAILLMLHGKLGCCSDRPEQRAFAPQAFARGSGSSGASTAGTPYEGARSRVPVQDDDSELLHPGLDEAFKSVERLEQKIGHRPRE